MLSTFGDLQKQIQRQVYKAVSIDNPVFRLHYRLTFWFLLGGTILVSSRQYIGEHIRCISDHVNNHVINTFCFFTTTFTIPRHNNDTQVPHPGVGPMGRGELEDEEVVHHSYYQWVPFVLFGQAIMFYLPHLLWRTIEGGTIKMLVKGLEHGALSNVAHRDYGPVLSRTQYIARVCVVRRTFMSRLQLNQWWGQWLMGCELLNALNLALQLVITDAFLGGSFFGLGAAVTNHQLPDTDPLDLIFPKVTKCLFTKYGPSGTIQKHDALCVMALNVINEKIYTFLWFWFIILAVFTALGLVWRMLTLLLHARSTAFNKMLFDIDSRLDPDDFEMVISRCQFSHWLFLYYLCKNMHLNAKNQLFKDLAAEMRGMKSNGYHNRATLPMPLSGLSPASPARKAAENDYAIPVKKKEGSDATPTLDQPDSATEPLIRPASGASTPEQG